MSWSCDYGEGYRAYFEEEVVAKKEHRCVECEAPILVGERYLRYRGRADDSWDTGAQHLLCRDACVWIRDALEGECISFGSLAEWWSEHKSPADLWDAWGRSDAKSQAAIDSNWRIGARMFAMVRRRERLAREAP